MGDSAVGVQMQRLTVMLRSRDHARHHSLATEVLARARRAHLDGATLLQAVEGQGRSGTIHRQHLFGEDMPLSIIIVDRETKLAVFLDDIRDVLGDALVVVDDVTAFSRIADGVMGILIVCCVAVGGFVGAPTRFLVDRVVADRVESDFPWGTFLINVSGSFLLGLLTGLDLAGHMPALVKALVGTGFCGAYTTFSTWSFETVRLLEEGEYLEALLNAFVSLCVGLLAAAGGIALGLVR